MGFIKNVFWINAEISKKIMNFPRNGGKYNGNKFSLGELKLKIAFFTLNLVCWLVPHGVSKQSN